MFEFSHIVIFHVFIQTIKKIFITSKLNQHIKQLQMDRNSKEINLAKLNSISSKMGRRLLTLSLLNV